ncbi:TBRG4, partial [Symbiodinium pilosum]
VAHRHQGQAQPPFPPMPLGPGHQASNYLLATGPVPMPTATPSPGDREEAIREACKAHDIGKAALIISKLPDDEGLQILPNVLEELCQGLVDVAEADGEEGRLRNVNAENLAELAHQMGRIPVPAGQQIFVSKIMQIVADKAKYRTEEMQPRYLARMVWGYAGAGSRNDSLMSVVAAAVVNKSRGFSHEELANTAWAFAKCGLWNAQLAQCLQRECMEKIDTFSTQSLASISWAMAQWGTREEPLLRAIAQALHRQKAHFEPAQMSMVSWAFSTLSFKYDPLMNAIMYESIEQISQFSNSELAHLAWAFANLRVQDRGLHLAISQQVQRNSASMEPPEIANIAWAFAKNQMGSDSVMRIIAEQAEPQIGSFKAAEITMLTWAFAVSGQQHVGLMSEIGSKVAKRAEKFSPAQLAHVTWAFGALAMRQQDLCERVAMCFEHNKDSFTAQGLVQIVWGFAMVQYRDKAFMDLAAPYIIRGIHDLKPLALWRCAWAYNTLLVSHAELRKAVLAAAARRVNEFSLKGLARLVESYMIGHRTPNQEGLELHLKERLSMAVQGFNRLFPDFASLSEINDEALPPLQHVGMADLRVFATKSILEELGFSSPNWGFVSRCLKEVHRRRLTDCVAFEVKVDSALQQAELNEFHVRAFGEGMVDDDVLEATSTFVADVFGSTPASEAVLHALAEVCASIYRTLLVHHQSEADCQAVRGNLRMFLSQVPSFSSIALLVQLRTRFPNVKIEFVEMQMTPPKSALKCVGMESQ